MPYAEHELHSDHHEEKQSHQMIASYVRQRWDVSTMYRQSSAMMANAPWYYETIVWAWDPKTYERGRTVGIYSGGLRFHFEACAILLKLADGTEPDDALEEAANA